MDKTIDLNKRLESTTSFKSNSYYNGIFLGLFLSADMIIKLINTLLPAQNVLVVYYMLIIALGLFVNRFKFNIKYIFLFFVITALFGFSFMRVPDSYYTFQYFIYFCAFYFAGGLLQYQVSVKNIFKTINFMNIPYTAYLYFIVFSSFSAGNLDMNFTLNLSYTTLIGISSFLLSFKLSSFKQSKLFILINGLCVLTELYFMFFISNNRGALLGLAVLFALIMIRKLKNTTLRFVLVGTFIAVGVYIYNNLLNLVVFLINLAMKYDMTSTLLSKTMWKLTYGDFDSGRSNLYENAMESFNQSPLFGAGIGLFPSQNNGQYPHNIFLDTLSSLGLFVSVILFAFCLFCLYKLLTAKNSDYIMLFILLFSLSLPRLMISSTLWMSPFFWTLVALIIINPKLKDEDYKEQTGR